MSKMTKMQLNHTESTLFKIMSKKIKEMSDSQLGRDSVYKKYTLVDTGMDEAKSNPDTFLKVSVKAYENNSYANVTDVFLKMPSVAKLMDKAEKLEDSNDKSLTAYKSELQDEMDNIMTRLYLGDCEDVIGMIESFRKL